MAVLSATCTTEGCGNQGLTIELEIEDGVVLDDVVCGACGQSIADTGRVENAPLAAEPDRWAAG